MNWKQNIFKARWQNKDPAIRREAVTTLQDPELLAALPGICLEDEDPGVRASAARRINDLGILAEAHDREADPETDKLIGQRIRVLTASVAQDRPPLKSRQKIVTASADRQLLELVASQAPEPELRKQALEKIERQGFLGDRAAQDPDPDIRRLAAKSVTQLSTLRRVIEETRKTDKVLHQDLLLRLHKELLAANDPQAVREEALSICQEIEAFALVNQTGPTAVPTQIASRWDAIEKTVPDDLSVRFQSTVTRLSQEATVADISQVEDSDSEPPAAELPKEISSTEKSAENAPSTNEAATQQPPVPADSGPDPLPGLSEEIERLKAQFGDSPPARKFKELQKRWNHAWSAIAEPGATERSLNEKASQFFAHIQSAMDAANERKDNALKQADSLLVQLKQQLDDGALHKALETRHTLQEMGKAFKKDHRWKSVNREMSARYSRIRELRDWHHWSNDKIRNQLIAEMELLPQTDLHPDAILDRIKSLQKQWKEIEKSEQIPGDSHYHAAPWMWRKFSAAGHKAFAATKPFLEKRDEIRDRHLQSTKDVCARLKEAAQAESPDWPELGKHLREARKELRDLDQLPQKARRKVASRLRKALEKGNAVMQGHYEEVEKHKLKLIRAASQLTHVEDMDEAIREAKRLQADWKKAGSLWRSKENELWKAFREPLDPLFGKLKEGQESERAEIQQRLEAQESLCKELQELLSGSDQQLTESQGKVQGLKDGWRDIERPNRRLQDRFKELATTFDQRISAFRQKQADQVSQNWWHKSKILHGLENSSLEKPLSAAAIKKAAKDWPALESSEDIDVTLDARLAKLIECGQVEPATKDTAVRATELCIQLEFLSGLPSPAKEKDQRMKYQVDRLSKSLAGEGQRLSAAEEAANVEREWLTLPVLPGKDHARFEKRIKKSLKEISGSNSA